MKTSLFIFKHLLSLGFIAWGFALLFIIS